MPSKYYTVVYTGWKRTDLEESQEQMGIIGDTAPLDWDFDFLLWIESLQAGKDHRSLKQQELEWSSPESCAPEAISSKHTDLAYHKKDKLETNIPTPPSTHNPLYQDYMTLSVLHSSRATRVKQLSAI